MSSQVALIANEPVRQLAQERPRQLVSELQRAGVRQVAQPTTPPVSATSVPAEVDATELDVAIENIRNFVSDMKRELDFSIDEDSGRTIITVIDSDSGKVIRQIPSEEVMQLAKTVADGAFNLIDRRA